ncbi:V-set and transmembrane domain-containing protein 5 [Protopterus annectens]|uniref:V-set and transmembrane domain-containing protein 5 n=1 Tax=Protopterus annectens TaxID=7888 RepID=UPI001CF9FD52|nr:V-set and transmembrane domain-containing protein 5 [Protopterus annectens]
MRTSDYREKSILLLWTLTFAGSCLQNPRSTLDIPQEVVNTTMQQNVTLSVKFLSNGTPTIEWKHLSKWGRQCIIVWKPGIFKNISEGYKDRINNYENGSIQLIDTKLSDSGYYDITVTEDSGFSKHGALILNVYEVLYEDLHFSLIITAFLIAVLLLMSFFCWLCNTFVEKIKQRQMYKAEKQEEFEMKIV